MINKDIKIEGEKIFLQLLRQEHAGYFKWLCDPVVNKYLKTKQATLEGTQKYILEKNGSKNCLFLGIFLKDNGKHIGNIKLEPINFKKREAIFGLLIGDKNYWGKGLGTEATNLITNYGFEKLGLKKINLGVVPENKAAIRVYEKSGFKVEKTDKDEVSMSLIK